MVFHHLDRSLRSWSLECQTGPSSRYLSVSRIPTLPKPARHDGHCFSHRHLQNGWDWKSINVLWEKLESLTVLLFKHKLQVLIETSNLYAPCIFTIATSLGILHPRAMSRWPSGQRRRVAPVTEKINSSWSLSCKNEVYQYQIISHHIPIYNMIREYTNTWHMIWCHIITITTYDSGLSISGWARLMRVSGPSVISILPEKGNLHCLEATLWSNATEALPCYITNPHFPYGRTPHPGHLVVHEKMSGLEGQPRFALHSPEQALGFHSYIPSSNQ